MTEKKHTKDMLADELLKIGLMDMSLKARSGYYHDFLSPLATPELQLVADLGAVMNKVDGARQLRQRVMNGEFDANLEESEAWANSPEGRAAMQALTNSKKRQDRAND